MPLFWLIRAVVNHRSNVVSKQAADR